MSLLPWLEGSKVCAAGHMVTDWPHTRTHTLSTNQCTLGLA